MRKINWKSFWSGFWDGLTLAPLYRKKKPDAMEFLYAVCDGCGQRVPMSLAEWSTDEAAYCPSCARGLPWEERG